MRFDAKEIASRDYSKEFEFQTSRSSGPGGQHVNKVETRVTLKFPVLGSKLLEEGERARLLLKWKNKLNSEHAILIHSEKHRSQHRNREDAIKIFKKLLEKAFTDPKPRKKTKPSKGAIQERLNAKKKHSDKKQQRRKPEY